MTPNSAFAQVNATTDTNTTNTIAGSDNGDKSSNMDMITNDNYGKPMMGMEHKKYEKINGTVNVMDTMYKAIESKFNVTLTQAITTAEQSVGNGSYALSANGEEKDGFLLYSVVLGSPDMNFTKVLVDPGNGEVLQTENISTMEWIMHMHSQGHQDMGMKGMHDSSSGSHGQGYGDYNKGMKGMYEGGKGTGYGNYNNWDSGQRSGW